MTDQTEREALVQAIASSLAMSYGSHVNAPKGGRDWKAAEDLLGVLEHLGLRRIDPDDEALVERCATAIAASVGQVGPLAWAKQYARAALKAALS